MKRAPFITFEGIDGSGKSTQVKLLAQYLRENGTDVYITREPGGTPLAESLRNILLDTKTGHLSPLSELFLYLASRREHLDKIILPKLEEKITVISDRFADSSVAYQGLGRGISPVKVDELNKLATDSNYPDITFLLDIDPHDGLERLNCQRSQPLDRLESEGIDFLAKIRKGYLWIAEREPQRVIVIDAKLSIKEIANIIRKHVDIVFRDFKLKGGHYV